MELSMVAVNIQSVDDIIAAYLKYLKFSDKQARKLAAILKGQLVNQDNIVDALDGLLVKPAKKVLSGYILTDAQAVALYKFCFLQAGGAKKWGVMLFDENSSAAFAEALRKEIIINAPVYTISHMEAQKIEPVLAHGFWHNWWHHHKNG